MINNEPSVQQLGEPVETGEPERSVQVGPDLAAKVTLARIRREQDATEMDLIQFLMSRGGDA